MFAILQRNSFTWSSLKTIADNLKTISGNSKIKPILLCPSNTIKTIVEKQEGKTLVVEGVISPSPREHLLIKPEPHTECKACPLCSLNLDVKHTDVLILSQFVRQNGSMLPKRITGLCSVQHKRVSYMVTMAHKAGLMGKFKPKDCTLDPRHRPQWKQWNSYFDETTIKPPKIYIAMRYKKKLDAFKKQYES
ncbi:39S ribosomal protein S18a, mitochondrial [Macrosteles quadrilineatus]|uniref:39S ribosomal protein S18a, mitochondrial n=1 Tax=Macrosteles quadrilineatus TaxID=74068 RepID=UPI0023E35049|nr:39S ribosomal protein S18a, mitochondrial [Macrosteles quadrilineatus]